MNKIVFLRGQKGNYFTCDGDKIYYPERSLQSEIGASTEPFIFVDKVTVINKGNNHFIKGRIKHTKPLEKLAIMDYILENDYTQLIKIFTEKTECLYAVENTGDYDIIKILADTGDGIEDYIAVVDDGYNKTGFLRGLLKNWSRGTKKLDILIYSDLVKTRELAKDAIKLDANEALFLGAYLRLKTKKKDCYFINDTYVRSGNVVCFRTKDLWYFDSMNFIPYLKGDEPVIKPLSQNEIEKYIEDNMLAYRPCDDEIIYKRVYMSDDSYYSLPLVNINVVDYYSLKTDEVKDMIEDCKCSLESVRREAGRNATRTNATFLSKLTKRQVLELDA